ncbi:MAG: hypothetical protein OXR82_18070 [Gammaproteobacteria bacterium]|nr:hypothetical protein [Gammaproteobacteria bacterium]
MATSKVRWLTYEFGVYDSGTSWRDIGGLYIFTGKTDGKTWEALYIGQTSSFKDRLPGHPKWSDAVLLGATHIHAKTVTNEKTREKVEQELIEAYQPPLNDQHK